MTIQDIKTYIESIILTMSPLEFLFDKRSNYIKNQVYNKFNIKSDDDFKLFIASNLPNQDDEDFENEISSINRSISSFEKNKNVYIKNSTLSFNSAFYPSGIYGDMRKEEIQTEFRKKIAPLLKRKFALKKLVTEKHNRLSTIITPLEFISEHVLKQEFRLKKEMNYKTNQEKSENIIFSDIRWHNKSQSTSKNCLPKNWNHYLLSFLNNTTPTKSNELPYLNNYVKRAKHLNSKDFSKIIALKTALKNNIHLIDSNKNIHLQMSGGIMASINFSKQNKIAIDNFELFLKTSNNEDNIYVNNIYNTGDYSTSIVLGHNYLILTNKYFIEINFSASPFLIESNNIASFSAFSTAPIEEDRLEQIRLEEEEMFGD
ncbi:hypothetical protein [Pontimicrobium sp. IMCC45349]|uniref:hypothetical protein n=1 Tax=Pontimicrobium sp. IMCC45349 TaxID=3391574 RepID=UPI0039A20367